MFKISKSDYVLGLKCPNALWFKKFRKDLQPEMDQAILDQGKEIGLLAQKVFSGGTTIVAKPWEYEASQSTRDAIKANVPYIYEATLATSTGEYCAVDILRNNRDGTWDIIEVKSTTKPHDYHYLDASFQRYVFTQSGINIHKCFIMTLNPEYIRQDKLNVEDLFALHDVTEDLQDTETVKKLVNRLRQILDMPSLGIAISKTKCNRFYECGYKCHCWKNIPSYSVFDAFKGTTADEVYSEYGADLRNVPAAVRSKQMHPGDIEAFLNNTNVVINKKILHDFVNSLQYPLYFLDYESIMPAVPMFYNSRPYQQICFQFSLHVQRKPGDELEHYEYLHNNPNTDPRPELIKHLIENIGDTGSVIVYNQAFEETRNTEMVRDFPAYADHLQAINKRMIDLLLPFRERGLYRPCQNGSASIKQTLPAFVPEMTYDNLGIHNGTEASNQFMDFMTGKQTPQQTDQMMANLHEYCGQDTLAEVMLLDVIKEFLKPRKYHKHKINIQTLLSPSIDREQIVKIAKQPNDYYNQFKLHKRSGGFRIINAPQDILLVLQTNILNRILYRLCTPHNSCVGFVKKKSIVNNVKPHLSNQYVLKTDIKDFFGSIKSKEVREFFYNTCGLSVGFSRLLARLCCFRGVLPQGAPTSPMISNMILLDVDTMMSNYCESKGCVYTRYADDITISSSEPIRESVFDLLEWSLQKHGLVLNKKKTRLYEPGNKKIITGVSISSGKMKVPRSYKRSLRMEIHKLEKYGLEICKGQNPFYLEYLKGKIGFLKQIEPDSDLIIKFRKILKTLDIK